MGVGEIWRRVMSTFDLLESLLGAPNPQRQASVSAEIWREIEEDFSVELPDEVKRFLNSYGGIQVSEYISIFAPGAILDVHDIIGSSVTENPSIDEALLPTSGGMIIWGSTVNADQLFLVQRSGGWSVAAWCRQWGEWYESPLGLAEWALQAFSPESDIFWLPKWEYP